MSVPFEVPYNYLPEQFARPDDIFREWESLIYSSDFTLGRWVAEIENLFAQFTQSKYALAVNNGTDALVLALKALEVGPGDEVITPCNSFYATTGAIVAVGATPVFCDVDNRYQIDVTKIEELITKKTKAILPVHWGGASPDMKVIVQLANNYSLRVVEDACMGIGTRLDGIPAGTFGQVGAYSLHPLKSLNVMGDGGFVTTNDRQIYEWMSCYRNHGMTDRDHISMYGLNHRMQPLQAVVAKHELGRLEGYLNARRQNVSHFDSLVLACDTLKGKIILPSRWLRNEESFCLYMLLASNRDKLISWLRNNGIDARIHYPIPLHLQKASKEFGYKDGDFPVAEDQANRLVTLPMHQYLTRAQLDHMFSMVSSFYAS